MSDDVGTEVSGVLVVLNLRTLDVSIDYRDGKRSTNSKAFQSLQDLKDSPILLLDSISRIAFVLHHLLGFKISDAAEKARLTEKQYRAQLRRAYLQLASSRLEDGTRASQVTEKSASAWEQNYELVEMDSCLLV